MKGLIQAIRDWFKPAPMDFRCYDENGTMRVHVTDEFMKMWDSNGALISDKEWPR